MCGKEILFVDSNARSAEAGNSIIKPISVAFEPDEEMLFFDSKSQCNVCTQACPKLFYNHLVSLLKNF